jgi:SAM-dependent methyltransferase
MPSIIQQVVNAFAKRWGSAAARKRAWDSEYATGKWTYERNGPNNEAQEPIYRYLAKYGAGGSILDLGCGSGMTALEMTNNFDRYVGVDVSELATEKARGLLAAESDRSGKVSFHASDIFTFEPARTFSLMLFRESIYYVPVRRIEPMLRRYASHLDENGVFIVRLCDRQKYQSIVGILESNFAVLEKYLPEDSTLVILICSPARGSKSA